MNKNFLDVFYNVLIKEASVGRVDCYFYFNIRFDTRIIEDNIHIIGNNNDNSLVPTLIIKDKNKFNSLLVKYVELALDFYDEFIYYDEIRNSNYWDNELGISREKMIMTLLWSNATIEDFNDPCEFLRKRIKFFKLGNLNRYLDEVNIGYSKVLGYDVSINIVKNGLENETPYSLKVFLLKPDSGYKVYEFPNIYFGMCDNNIYIYAIQNNRFRLIRENLTKKIDRLMYKVNNGLNVKEDNYENYGIGNLKDITPNSLVVLNIFTGLLKNIGINKVIVPSILVTRWNAKMTILNMRIEKLIKSNGDKEIINKLISEDENIYNSIQSNMTEKFLRVFRRLIYHHSSLELTTYPFENNSNLEFIISNEEDNCNNELLNETFMFFDKEEKLDKRKNR